MSSKPPSQTPRAKNDRARGPGTKRLVAGIERLLARLDAARATVAVLEGEVAELRAALDAGTPPPPRIAAIEASAGNAQALSQDDQHGEGRWA